MFFRIVLGILSGPGALLFARFLRHMSYVSLSKYSCRGVCGYSLLSKTSPSKSCHGWPGIRGTQIKSSVRMKKMQESSK